MLRIIDHAYIEGIITIIMQELEVWEKEAIFGHHSILGQLGRIDVEPRDTGTILDYTGFDARQWAENDIFYYFLMF